MKVTHAAGVIGGYELTNSPLQDFCQKPLRLGIIPSLQKGSMKLKLAPSRPITTILRLSDVTFRTS
jgi:hypothetical protein